MELNLPLKKGERPLFKALELLENIYRDYKRSGNVYETVTGEYIINCVAQINVLAEMLRLREMKGIRNNSNDIFKHLEELPIFFTTKQVKEWEVEKKWNKIEFIPSKSTLIEYEVSFDTLTPSTLYQTKSETTEYIWQQWMIKTPIKEVIETLEYSAKSLLEWNSLRPEKTVLENNIENISKYLDIKQTDTKGWTVLQILANRETNLWNFYLKENNQKDNIENLISIWEKALNLEIDSINSLFFDNSTLVSMGFLKPINKRFNNWPDFWKESEGLKIPNLYKKLLNQENIINLFLKEIELSDFPVEIFNYLKGIKEKISIISQLKRGKVIIYGKQLSGKKSLVKRILKELNYKGFIVNHTDGENKVKLEELRLADKLLSTFENSALIVNNAEDIYNLKDKNNRLESNSLQFWTVSDKEKIHPNMLKEFDLVIELDSPPLKERINIAKLFFEDESIAIRVAQSLKENFEILRLGKLCQLSNNYSWASISLLMNSFNALENKESKISLNKLDNDDDIVNLVGYPNLKEVLDDIVNFYKNPNKYIKMGAKTDRGVLLIGPPGTGKTHFVRNLSKIVDIPIFAPETSSIATNIEHINQMFKDLKRQAPCILFLDEIDSLIANPIIMGIVDLEKQKIVNSFLSNVDGIEANDGILIVGATHRKGNFDPAATRSGRLSKVINLSLPNEVSRKEIWKEHLKNKNLDSSVTLNELSMLSVSFSCADIMEASNKATTIAVKSNREKISINDFKIACDETFWGYSDNNIVVTEKQKKLTAYHEAGHALLAWRNNYDVQRITIHPRGNYVGATHFVAEEGLFNLSMDGICKKIQIMLGGICAEKVMVGQYENGGVGDLKSASNLVYHAITEAGLGKEGPLCLKEEKFWSEERKVRVEKEEKLIMNAEFDNTEQFLNLNKELLIELSEYLLKYREASGDVLNDFKNKLRDTININNINVESVQHVVHKDE